MADVMVVTFYQFVALPQINPLREQLFALCEQAQIKGTILLAPEGINATISGSQTAIQAVQAYLSEEGHFNNLSYKTSWCDYQPFMRLKVRLRPHLVSIGASHVDPNTQVGTYVQPGDWNTFLNDPDVMVIDTRNQYEITLGTFKNAHNPNTSAFHEFPDYVDKVLNDKKSTPLALFCTGGIRCEKATSYLLQQGFAKVYHLAGGILHYLQSTPEANSLWQGECFVFDDRVSLNHQLSQGTYQLCESCDAILSAQDRTQPSYEKGNYCPHCYE